MTDIAAPIRSSRSSTTRRRRVWPWVVATLVVLIGLLVLLWDWDWFRPLVEARASAELGRKVTIGHLDVRLSRHPTVLLDNVEIANPDGFSGSPYLAHVGQLAVTADAMAYLRDRRLVLTQITLDHPDVDAIALPDGQTNYAIALPASSSSGPATEIGNIAIADGQAHVLDPKLRADFQVMVATDQAGPEGAARIVAAASGTYAAQPITGQAVGGALLSLRDPAHPYPIEAHLANGPTKLDLTGTVQDPVHFRGTNLKLHLDGPNLALLLPLTGIAIPATPPYDITGALDYADKKIRFTDFRGRLGSSDLEGTIAVDPTGARPVVDADLTSRRIDLADLGGFIGSQPGRVSTPDQTEAQKRQVERAEASSQLIPNTPINMPKVKAADVHLRFKGDSLYGRGIPFDSFAVVMDIVDGVITLHPVSLGVGRGSIDGDISLHPAERDDLHAKADIRFDHVDVGRMLAATGAVKGAGLLGGRADIDATGNSLAALLGHGDGNVRLMMAGGNLSALIVDLSGLEFGNALLSALGLPNRAQLQCFVADLALRHGHLDTRTLLAVTSEADVTVTGQLDLLNEALDYRLRTDSRHFSVGSLPTDIHIGGTLKKPSIAPEAGELAARGGAAVALGVLLTPLAALLPTVQLGTGDENENACVAAVHANGKRATASSTATPPPAR